MSNLILPRPLERETITLSPSKMNLIAEVSQFLVEARLNIICPECSKIFGFGKDGVVGDNDPGASVVTIRCGCTVRRCEMRGH